MPFAGYKDFADCVSKNSDKKDPQAYCGTIQSQAESQERSMLNPLGLAPGKHVRLFDAYIEAREAADAGLMDAEEAMSVSDFPTYIGALIRLRFLDRFQEIQGAWRQYTRDFSVEDFQTWSFARWGRFPDIQEKAFNAQYEELSLNELPGENIKLREWGNAISITRQLIISDRLNQIAQFPTLLADALARTISKVAAIDQFQSNPTMFDGNALISAAHNNLAAATALSSDIVGMNLLKAMELQLATQVDDEGYKVVPTGGQITLIYPTNLRWVVRALTQNDMLPNAANFLQPNEVAGRYGTIEEPFFTDTNNYYMAADMKGPLGFLGHITLNGNDTPFLGLKDPGVRSVLGGNDPYSFEFDEIAYKLRHDYNFKPVEWRGIVGALVP
jgi:hypothetical protein